MAAHSERLLYLVLTTRLLDKQVSAVVKGHTSSGKSWTLDQVLRFFPSDAYIEITAMSEKALIYLKEDFAHRTIVVFEAVALREGVKDDMTAYLVRSLLSEGRIRYPVTVRGEDGNWTSTYIVRDGPTNLVLTTTQTRVHEENETRVLSLTTDDSREQTRRVMREIASESDGAIDLSEWQELQAWLEDTGERRVTVPYAPALAELIPAVAVRLRRDFSAVLALIRAHAILHQRSRSRDGDGRIVAVLEDYAVVRDLVEDVLSEGVGSTVPVTTREAVGAVADLEDAHEDGVPTRVVADALDLDNSAAWRRLRAATDRGFVVNREERPRRPGRWAIGEPLPDDVELLPQSDDPELRVAAGQANDCTIAGPPEWKGTE